MYQDVRLPRAQKAQATARQAGQVYEMQTPEMKGKTYEDCLPLVRDSLKDRMGWIWTGDIEAEYKAAKQRLVDSLNTGALKDGTINSINEHELLVSQE